MGIFRNCFANALGTLLDVHVWFRKRAVLCNKGEKTQEDCTVLIIVSILVIIPRTTKEKYGLSCTAYQVCIATVTNEFHSEMTTYFISTYSARNHRNVAEDLMAVPGEIQYCSFSTLVYLIEKIKDELKQQQQQQQ